MASFVLLDDALVAPEDAHIPYNDRAFRYGDSVFETIRVHNGSIYHYAFHLARLERGLAALAITYDTAMLAPALSRLLLANQLKEGLIRLQISRGHGSQGYLPVSPTPLIVMETLPLTAFSDDGVLRLSSWRKTPGSVLPNDCKLGQGGNSILARMEAARHDADEALLLSIQGLISEASSANIIWQKNRRYFTPSLACDALPGSIRAVLLRLLPITEIEAPLEALGEADAVCLVNCNRLASGVARLQDYGWQWQSAGMAEYLRSLLSRDMDDA